LATYFNKFTEISKSNFIGSCEAEREFENTRVDYLIHIGNIPDIYNHDRQITECKRKIEVEINFIGDRTYNNKVREHLCNYEKIFESILSDQLKSEFDNKKFRGILSGYNNLLDNIDSSMSNSFSVQKGNISHTINTIFSCINRNKDDE